MEDTIQLQESKNKISNDIWMTWWKTEMQNVMHRSPISTAVRAPVPARIVQSYQKCSEAVDQPGVDCML